MRPPVALAILVAVTCFCSCSAAVQYKTTSYSTGGSSYTYSGSWSNSWSSGNPGGSLLPFNSLVSTCNPCNTPLQTVQTNLQSLETVEPLRTDQVSQTTTLDFLSPNRLRITIGGPYPASSSYKVKFHLNLNHGFNGVKTGDYNQELTLAPGNPWSHTFPNIRPGGGDSIHYLVEVSGEDGNRWWSRQFTGFYQLPQPVTQGSWSVDIKPSGSVQQNAIPTVIQQNPRPQQRPRPVVATPKPVVATPKPVVATPNPVVAPPKPVPPVPQEIPNYNKPIPRPTVNHVPQVDYRPQQPSNPGVPPPKQEQCRLSLTSYNNGKKACAGQSVLTRFEFNSVEQIGGNEPDEAFTVFSHENIYKNENADYHVATIFPSLLEEKYGAGSLDKTLTLSSCTAKQTDLCRKKGQGYFILPPVLSGRETTADTLSFRYGILEVRAKLPSGDWVVPELWLLPKYPKYGKDSGRIVLALSRGNRQLSNGTTDYSNSVLEAGVLTSTGSQMFRTTQNRPWSDDFHKIKLVWTPDVMEFYVDNRKFGEIKPINKLEPYLGGTKMAPYDEEFYLVFGIHVGGEADFPDSVFGKPWTNKEPKNKIQFWRERQTWHSTWNEGTSLQIAGLSLTALS